MPSEKCAARRGSVEDGMRMITACFARAPQRCTSRTYRHFLLVFHEVRSISKTCNQLRLMMSGEDGVSQIIKACVTVFTCIALTGRLRVIKAALDDLVGLTRWAGEPIWPEQQQ